jgi:glycosyltransferase involved in cell wall biosynthesis
MRLALVTTPPSVRSGIGDYTRHLLPYLREHADVDLYVAPGLECAGHRSARELDPAAFDRILFQLGNERHHAFMVPLLRATGGAVMLHDWVLFDLALAAFPEIARGGWRGHVRALREGGVAGARVYVANRRARREARGADHGGPPGLVDGWHAAEPGGRWTAERASVVVETQSAAVIELRVHGVRGRRLEVIAPGGRFARALAGGEERIEIGVRSAGRHLFELRVDRTDATEEQLRNGDTRTLGVFVRSIEARGSGSITPIDLSAPAASPRLVVDLTRDRFALALNRTIVSSAGAFLVHGHEMERRVRAVRGEDVPLQVVHHGAEKRWRGEPREATRARLGLGAGTRSAFLVVSLGTLQPHKRIDVLVEAVAIARRTNARIELALVGAHEPDVLDARRLARAHGIESALHMPGWVPEETGFDWLHAADVCANLRGPSTGGTSGGIFQALSLGKPVIASDLAEQRELPESCVARIAHGPGEAAALARRLLDLAEDRSRIERMASAAREFVETQCHWSHTAAGYARFLDGIPAPRGSRSRLSRTA